MGEIWGCTKFLTGEGCILALHIGELEWQRGQVLQEYQGGCEKEMLIDGLGG